MLVDGAGQKGPYIGMDNLWRKLGDLVWSSRRSFSTSLFVFATVFVNLSILIVPRSVTVYVLCVINEQEQITACRWI